MRGHCWFAATSRSTCVGRLFAVLVPVTPPLTGPLSGEALAAVPPSAPDPAVRLFVDRPGPVDRLLASRPMASFFKRITEKAATNIKLPEYPG